MTNLRGFDFKRNSPCQYQMKCVEKSMKNSSYEWPRQNFSLQYQYNIKQASDKNIEKNLN